MILIRYKRRERMLAMFWKVCFFAYEKLFLRKRYLFCDLYKKIFKINKNLLTKVDKGAIIVNCIIIAYYAQIANKQAFVSINLYII